MFEVDDETGGHLGDKFQWQINNNKNEKETLSQHNDKHIEKTFFHNNNNCLVSLTMENIELNSLKYDNNNSENNNNPVVTPEDNNNCYHLFTNEKSVGYSYTPERLIKNKDYRILTASPELFTDRKTPQDVMNSTDPYKFGELMNFLKICMVFFKLRDNNLFFLNYKFRSTVFRWLARAPSKRVPDPDSSSSSKVFKK